MSNNPIMDHNKRLLVSALAAVGAVTLSSAASYALTKPKHRIIKVIAKKFEFVPKEIKVKQGETVEFHFTAPEVPMGFNLADFAVRADIMPGKVSTLQLTPDKAGSFIFLCDVFCGSGHEEMSGTLIVV
jgi:cytochrome c oxidase subunit II